MQTPSMAYLAGVAGAAASRAMTVGSGVLALWLLTRILSVEAFGGYAAAMAAITLVGFAAGLGIERTMILRIAERPPVPGRLAGRRLVLRTAAVVLALSAVAALSVAWIAGAQAEPGGEGIAAWLVRLAPVIPILSLLLVLTHWYEANHRPGTAQAMFGVSDVARCAAFAAVFALGLGAPAVAAAAAFGAALPVAVLAALAAGRTDPEPGALRPRDLSDGLQFVTIRVAQMGLRQLDLVAMGLLAGAVEVATYAVASRLGALAQFGTVMFAATYAPRARRHRAVGDRAAMAREYGAARMLAFLAAIGIVLVLLLLGRWALGLFGPFEAGYGPLLLLLAGHLVAAATGNHVPHLTMTGGLRLAAANRIATLALFVVLLALLVPGFGGWGAAGAFLIATLLHETVGCVAMRRREGIAPLGPASLGALGLALGGVLWVALLGAAPWVGAALLLGAAAVTLAAGRRALARALGLGAR